MTCEQLNSIIRNYKKRAAEEHLLQLDLDERNRLLKIVHELEDNFEEYLEYKYDPDDLDAFMDIHIENEKPLTWWSQLSHDPDDDLSLEDEIDLLDLDDSEDEDFYIDDENLEEDPI